VAGQWFSPGTLVSSTNKADHHDTAESGAKHHNPNPLYQKVYFLKFQRKAYRMLDKMNLLFKILVLQMSTSAVDGYIVRMYSSRRSSFQPQFGELSQSSPTY